MDSNLWTLAGSMMAKWDSMPSEQWDQESCELVDELLEIDWLAEYPTD